MTSRRWRKSSHSANTDSCVEVANTLDTLRDSKNPGGPVLAVGNLTALMSAVRAGRVTR